MAQPPPTFASLEGLLEPSRREGFDIRPTLLRVLTDLYLQSRVHTAEDENYYTELALRLIDAVDVAARAAVARQLADYPDAPHAVIMRLARDAIEVAEPVLKFSSRLRPADLQAIARDCSPAHAEIVARRAPAALPQESGGEPSRLGADEADGLCDVFFAAAAAERRLILTHMAYAGVARTEPAAADASTLARLETAALQHNSGALARELTRALGIGDRLARRIVEDELGHPLIVAAKALRCPSDVVQRMLLFVNPQIGQSVQRVFELASLYEAVPLNAALRLVAIWRAADPAGNRPSRERPVFARRARGEAMRFPADTQAAPPADGLRAHPFRTTR